MQSPKFQVVLAGVLLALTISLQGCFDSGCQEGPVSTYGTVNGQIEPTAINASAEVTCNEANPATTYLGPELTCVDELAKVCSGTVTAKMTGEEQAAQIAAGTLTEIPIIGECVAAPMYTASALLPMIMAARQTIAEQAPELENPPPQLIVPEGTDIKEELELLVTKMTVELSEDKCIVCTPYPEAHFKQFDTLTEDQQKAAKGLDCNKGEWDKRFQKFADIVLPGIDECPIMDKKKWAALTPEEMEHATALGWTQVTWDWKSTVQPKEVDGTEAETSEITAEFTLPRKMLYRDLVLKTLKGYKKQGYSISPMAVSMAIAMSLVLAVSIRALTKRNPRAGTIRSGTQESELLEGGTRDKESNFPESTAESEALVQ